MVITISEAGQKILDSVKQLAANNPSLSSDPSFAIVPFTQKKTRDLKR